MNSILESGLNIAGVVLAFSILIFIHELGHYLAARIVGVRVEKFIIGFDVWGLGLRKKIGNTEYGVGLLPLGGYVKLAGASDLPGEEECTGAPDELMSKGPLARGFVFIAGVIMNLILGYFVIVAAQMYGVPRVPAVLGYITPQSPAARAGLEAGDRVISIDGKKIQWFEKILYKVALSGHKSLEFKVERNVNGKKVIKEFDVFPEEGGGRGNLLTIGAGVPRSRKIGAFVDVGDKKFDLSKKIAIGGRIIAVNGIEVENDLVGDKINELVMSMAGKKVTLTIKPKDKAKFKVEAKVYPEFGSTYDYGIRYMRMIDKVMPNSPASRAGLKIGDWIGEIDGKLFSKPNQMVKLIQQSALKPIDVKIRRNEKIETVKISPRAMTGDHRIPKGKENFLGIILKKQEKKKGEFVVEKVLSGGPSSGRLKSGDEIVAIAGNDVNQSSGTLAFLVDKFSSKTLTISVIRKQKEMKLKITPKVDPAIGVARIGIIFSRVGVFSVTDGSFADKCGVSRFDRNPLLRFSDDLKTSYLSWTRKQSNGKLKRIGEKKFPTPLNVLENPIKFGIKGILPIQLPTNFEMDKTEGFLAACSQAVPKTVSKILSIYKFLNKLIVGDVKITAAGGPIIIFKTMYMSASVGFGKLLDIAAFISINLAVINILPLPALDGGHLFFVLIELIKGSPPSVKIREYAQYVGFFLLMGMMLLVTTIDVYYNWIK